MTTLNHFCVDEVRGFLPTVDPLGSLSSEYALWERVAADLPKLIVTDQLRSTINSLPPFPADCLQGEAEKERAMMILSYIGHAYVWGATPAAHSIPAVLAMPWYQVASMLGRPPVLSYASYALHNWRRFDMNRPPELGNIGLLQNFLGGADEEWFILIHVDIEHLAAPALRSLLPLQAAVANGDVAGARAALAVIGGSLERMFNSLARMPEYCDPYIYYNRVRPYIHGWKKNPVLPNGLLYEGVAEYQGVPQQFRGETGAQSSIVPCMDAVLGVGHEEGPLLQHLKEMREYMPPAHRRFMEHIEQGPSVRALVIANKESDPELKDRYNRCVTWIERFRSKHLEYAASYIESQKQSSEGNPTQVGTGGTPFMPYLKKHRNETTNHIV